ncbi:MAG: aromatic ring-hydroxylating dioxygenase subunit alpha [Pseudomonadota bacterium]
MATPHVKQVDARPTIVFGAAPETDIPIGADRYISESWLAHEYEALWPHTWMFACLERDIDEPGAYQVFNVGRESILITRNDNGELRAFFNVCQHRGARVMTNDFGWVDQFICPYHGWTYSTDGELVYLPDPERFSPRVDCAKKSLQPVQVSAWAGLVFVNMDLDAAPLENFLGPVMAAVDPYQLEKMTLVGDQTVSLACNWKAVFDNFGELYHVEHIHPQHEHLFDCPTAEIHLYEHGHTAVIIDGHTVNSRMAIPEAPNGYMEMQLQKFGVDPKVYQGRILEVRGDIPKIRREAGPRLGWDYSRFSDARLSDIEQYNLFPNTMITVQPDDALITRARPHPTDPNLCLWDKFTFHRQPDPKVAEAAGVIFEPHDAEDVKPIPRPEHDQFTQEDIIEGRKTMTITIDQDIHLIRDVQAGMHSRGFSHQTLCDDEIRIQHYHDWLAHRLGVNNAA